MELHFLKLLFLKLTFQIQVALHPRDPFLINNCSMTANSVENYCFIVMNIKLRVKRRFKIFIDFWNCYILLSPWAPLPTRFVLLKIFAYPTNKSVTYRLELKRAFPIMSVLDSWPPNSFHSANFTYFFFFIVTSALESIFDKTAML